MIIFKKIKFKNFGSFGNKTTEINLQKASNTLVCGNNGSGKSFALLDSITFALFGKPFRKINIPQLQNSINTKDCVVELEFDIYSDSYKIKRGLAPKIFEIHKNGKLLNQEAKTSDYQDTLEQQILKMNYKTFTQVVILGSSSFVPFMQLTASDRRAVIENILDINIFSTMNVLVKGKMSILKENIKEIFYSLELHKNKIEYQNKIINKANASLNVNLDNLKQEIESEIHKRNVQDSLLTEKLESKLHISEDESLDTLESELKKFDKLITQISLKMSDSIEERKFYEEKENCPKCKANIPIEIKEKNIQEIEKNIEQYKEADQKFTEKYKEIKSKIQKIKDIISSNSEIELEIKDIKNNISILNYSIDHKNKKLQEASAVQTNIDNETKILSQYSDELKGLEFKLKEKEEELENYQYVYDIIKDGGVKSKIVKHYLPTMNKYINKFLKSMDFFVQFHLDENFSETIKSRYRDEFSYMNFSEGEKMRIDLALLLAWREIAKLKNSVNCNLLILDEVFDSSLDSVGTDEVMKLLNTISQNANVFVISHKADQIVDKFTNVMQFEKKNNFSRLIEK
jgi:DNA repair exonuclease SbcCD ATPase subunit